MAATNIEEKPVQQTTAEHNEVIGSDKSDELQKIPTLGVDRENHEAEKGDDSDGKVTWTTKQILATIFLSALYVGQSCAEWLPRYDAYQVQVLRSRSTL